MAGLGSACSHLAALLFKLEACARLQLNKIAVTSELCRWNQTRKCAEPELLKKINFKRPRRGDLPQETSNNKTVEQNYTVGNFHSAQFKINRNKLRELQEVMPTASFFTSVTLDDDFETQSINSQTDTADENDINCIPEPLTSLYDAESINFSPKKLKIACDRSFQLYKATYDQKSYDNMTKATSMQSLSSAWKVHRGGRITASNFHEVCHKNLNVVGKNSLLNKLMNYTTIANTPALNYGRQCENKARTQFEEIFKKEHTCGLLRFTGLHVRADIPFLGASPDALINCTCHGEGLLEIKCPYKYRNGLSGWENDKDFPLNSDMTVKEKHKYYYQMQGQMLVSNRAFCYFFIWTPPKTDDNFLMLKVEKDDNFCKNMLEKLNHYFFTVLLSEVVTRKNDVCFDNKQQHYCSCKRPCFEPMIACDNKDCATEWYHYVCVNITRAPKGAWHCPDCVQNRKETN
ncbi:uncharacterized protein LOC130647255 [Hydractinia symbiolongicarpus]|uniref:uncharacterized protein LOC130647255 n=1 Tax=Hydractinia symbiolongicarpus TaxID=13093 RepID=UPI00254DA19E|nr:uncharacterized protein LOC130647255 [Hydractinia symbiolongicarpus]